ncbi:glutamine-fructose-6-phosphate transaminase (isomerizing) [Agrobacterium sp. DSM 25558]|uniref:hypothetical protein n=1 Tax=Agrobacterium sp. DSM 25558 TaxID=1907665 RepID=UPI0009725F7F|nr:hypothetical protein [Agrobacterium sp. DSM 25558]SCX29002.1 glutamine-fructose-6-phosphate transaminase (isomerizing) [Agrobacterium sp. DSM 25558]
MVSEAIVPKRDWIPAQASYATQAGNLFTMVDRLLDQLDRFPSNRPQRVAVVGIGASYAAAASAVYDMRNNGLDALRFLPSELPAGLSGFKGLTVLVSQSGRSVEIVDLARNADGADMIAITNYMPSPLGMLCEQELNLGNLSDSSVSFVSFTGTLLVLAMLNDHWNGYNRANHWKNLIAEAAEAPDRLDTDLREIAAILMGSASIDVVAPAAFMSVAEETALMFREGPRVFATALETRQYLHGSMDAAGSGAHLIFGGQREALLTDQLSQKTRRLVFVTGRDGPDGTGTAKHLVLPASLEDTMSFTIASTLVAQKLTLHMAAIGGVDINEAAFQRLDTKTDSLKTIT